METVTISKAELEHLQDRSLKLECLDNAGVDNWSGYGYAMEMYYEEKENEEEDDD